MVISSATSLLPASQNLRRFMRMADTRFLIVTPLKGEVTARYTKTMIELTEGQIPGFTFGHVFISGNCVMGARDWGAYRMDTEGYDGIVWWDSDLVPTTADFVRLVSHEQEFVCAAYCGRDTTAHWHFEHVPDTGMTPAGLWAVKKSAIGFARIKKSVFDKIRAAHPERTYKNREQGVDVTQLHQFHPWQIIGPNSDMGKLKRLKELLAGQLDHAHNATELLREVSGIVFDPDYSQNLMQGEDYGFCRMAREVGVDLWVDSKLVVGHRAEITLPIPHDDLVRMVAEPWRQDAWAKLKEDRAKGAA